MTYIDSWKVSVETMNLHKQHGQSKQKYLYLKNHKERARVTSFLWKILYYEWLGW